MFLVTSFSPKLRQSGRSSLTDFACVPPTPSRRGSRCQTEQSTNSSEGGLCCGEGPPYKHLCLFLFLVSLSLSPKWVRPRFCRATRRCVYIGWQKLYCLLLLSLACRSLNNLVFQLTGFENFLRRCNGGFCGRQKGVVETDRIKFGMFRVIQNFLNESLLRPPIGVNIECSTIANFFLSHHRSRHATPRQWIPWRIHLVPKSRQAMRNVWRRMPAAKRIPNASNSLLPWKSARPSTLVNWIN